jgi:diacylglycerol kinase
MSHRISFKVAFGGLKYALSTQPNFRIHLLITTLAVILALAVRLPRLEWLILLLTIALVLVAEMINTSLEAATDLLAPEYRSQAKIAKDVAAGMVLLTAILSVIIGLVIFIPKLWPYY